MSVLLLALAGLFVLGLAALCCLYLFLRLRRLERIEEEHFRYVDSRIDELASALYGKLGSVDQRFDIAHARLERTEAAAHVDHLLHLTSIARQRGDLAEAEAKALEQELLTWRDEARQAAREQPASAAGRTIPQA